MLGAIDCDQEKHRGHIYETFTHGYHQLIYLRLEFNLSRLDVNVHLRKLKVVILNQDENIAEICKDIYDQLVAFQLDYCSPAISVRDWALDRIGGWTAVRSD